VVVFDAVCELGEGLCQVFDCAVVEELVCGFCGRRGEDFRVGQAVGQEGIGAGGYGFDGADAEEFMICRRDYDVGLGEDGFVVGSAGLVAPVVDMVLKVLLCFCEDFRLIAKALAYNTEPEVHVVGLEDI